MLHFYIKSQIELNRVYRYLPLSQADGLFIFGLIQKRSKKIKAENKIHPHFRNV